MAVGFSQQQVSLFLDIREPAFGSLRRCKRAFIGAGVILGTEASVLDTCAEAIVPS